MNPMIKESLPHSPNPGAMEDTELLGDAAADVALDAFAKFMEKLGVLNSTKKLVK
jgi:hypothetical protein